MKFNLLATSLLSTLTITLGFNLSIPQAQADNEVQFFCDNSYDSESGALPTTFARTSRGKIPIIRWRNEDFIDADFSLQQRCDAFSYRFQRAYDKDSFSVITNSKINNQPVICATNKYREPCNELLMILHPEENVILVFNNIRKVFDGEQVGIPTKAEDIPQVYYQIDIENFLETAPIE